MSDQKKFTADQEDIEPSGLLLGSLFIVLVFFVGGFFGWLAGYNQGMDRVDALKKSAIESGYAEYDSTTGMWKWKGEIPEA